MIHQESLMTGCGMQVSFKFFRLEQVRTCSLQRKATQSKITYPLIPNVLLGSASSILNRASWKVRNWEQEAE